MFKLGHILEIHSVPACDERQRHEYRGDDGEQCHYAVLLFIKLGLIKLAYLRGIVSQSCGSIMETRDTLSKEAEISLLDQEVRAFEPHTALSGMEDGLYFYRKITAEASDYLRRDGIMILEIGADQAESVSGMLRDHGFRDIRLVQDLGGRDRVLMAKRKT